MEWLNRFGGNLAAALLIEGLALWLVIGFFGNVWISPPHTALVFVAFGTILELSRRKEKWIPEVVAILAWPIGAVIADMMAFAVITRFFSPEQGS